MEEQKRRRLKRDVKSGSKRKCNSKVDIIVQRLDGGFKRSKVKNERMRNKDRCLESIVVGEQ